VAVSAGSAVDGFNTATDFVFYQNENPIENAKIIASAQATTVGTVASSIITLPDGSTMTLVGVTDVTGLTFK
jgi:hypothetical protein